MKNYIFIIITLCIFVGCGENSETKDKSNKTTVITDDYSNTIVNAKEIDLNTLITGDLEVSDDIDYFKFTLTERSTISFEKKSNSGTIGTSTWSYFSIYNKVGTRLLNESIQDNVTTHSLTLDSGVYIVKIETFSNDITGYEFTLNATSGSVVNDDYSNTIVNAKEIDLNTLITGDLEVSDDIDYFKFTLTERSTISFEKKSNSGTIGTSTWSYFSIYNKVGTRLLNESIQDNVTTHSLTLDSGVYIVKIETFSNDITGYEFILNVISKN